MPKFATLQHKYAAEHEKRTRYLQNKPFSALITLRDGEAADMDKDSFASEGHFREDVLQANDEVKALIVGTGIHGLMSAQRLIEHAGLKTEEIALVDRAGGWGGTWYWNRYPGVMCDIEGYCYLPLLEETGYMPSQKYPPGLEIREQCERIAGTWKLRGQFCTTAKQQTWEADTSRWVVTLERSRASFSGSQRPRETFTVRAQFLILAGGIFPTPHYPTLNGLHHFKSSPGKKVMHTARWDWEISGGTASEPDLVKLQGKRVGLIGTGATAVQILPHVAKWAGHTYVFQRTPAYVAPHAQEKTTQEAWEKVARETSWQYSRMANLDAWMTREQVEENMVGDGWTTVASLSAFVGADRGLIEKGKEDAHIQSLLESDFQWTQDMRDRICSVVEDPVTAEKLTPWHPGFCRRPTFHDSYLDAFNRSDVTLVDTDGRGVTAYSAEGVVANGDDYDLDVLILATGYQVAYSDSCPSNSINASVIGQNGRTMRDKWEAEDFGTMFGIASQGFPNLFFCSTSGVGVSNNMTAVLSTVSLTTARIIREACFTAEEASLAAVEVTKAAEDEYTDQVAERSRWFSALPTCLPSVLFAGKPASNDNEQANKAQARRANWGGGSLGYQRLIQTWNNKGGLDGFTVTG